MNHITSADRGPSPDQPVRVLVVDDSAFMRRAMKQMLEQDPSIDVVATARDGAEAIDLACELQPDVITLDLEMPNVDGFTALQRIMHRCPTKIIILSSLTQQGSHAALRAMSLGAADVLAKDVSQVSLSITRMQEELVAHVRALTAHAQPVVPPRRARHTPGVKPLTLRERDFDLICIGSSTGGPACLETLLATMPATLRIPIVIAQHMPEMFTRSLAERLDEICPLTVRHAEHDQSLEAGHVYIAKGGRQIRVRKTPGRRLQLNLVEGSADALYRPSVDVLLKSAAESAAARTVAVVLTGMGTDGLLGARQIRAAGGKVIAQSAESCVVYGMPKAVTQDGLADAMLAPAAIARCLSQLAAPSQPMPRTLASSQAVRREQVSAAEKETAGASRFSSGRADDESAG